MLFYVSSQTGVPKPLISVKPPASSPAPVLQPLPDPAWATAQDLPSCKGGGGHQRYSIPHFTPQIAMC